jgi:metallo-beta-lactamase family protein
MKVTLFGAAGNVTGSAYYLQSSQSNVLIDFGIFQGDWSMEIHNHILPPVDIRTLDAVIITHAHLDHTGRLPLLVRNGYSGPIYATEATVDITAIILKDAVRIQEYETRRLNRKRIKTGEQPLEPDYTEEDVDKVMKQFIAIPYNRYVEVSNSVRARVREAGHILGSASIELSVKENRTEKIIIFSGDIGPQEMAILNDPDPFHLADLVFMESTYGDRDHRSLESTLLEGRDILEKAIDRKGKVLVPSFAIGRSQQLLYYMARAVQRGNLPEIPVYLDSPMAVEATKIYAEHPELYDDEAQEMVKLGIIKGDLSRINLSVSAEDSKALNDIQGPCMIMAGSGMCNAGRILHHLRHNLNKPETTVMMVGYQGHGSLGRRLLEGAKKVRIFGEEIEVNASISSMGGLSAHAGQSDLLSWFDPVSASKPILVLSHGENRSRQPLAQVIRERYGIDPILPEYGDIITL